MILVGGCDPLKSVCFDKIKVKETFNHKDFYMFIRSKKDKKTFDILPYTKKELMAHLESQFDENMTWENYGQWHIDHVYPQSKLPYDSLEHPNFQKCWALENLRPLCAKENIRKSDKIIQ